MTGPKDPKRSACLWHKQHKLCAAQSSHEDEPWAPLLTGLMRESETHLDDNAISSKHSCSQGVENVVEGVVEGHNGTNLHMDPCYLEAVPEY